MLLLERWYKLSGLVAESGDEAKAIFTQVLTVCARQGLARFARWVGKARERRCLRAILGAMSRRELADIGLARGDIERVACGLPPPRPRPPRATIDHTIERSER